ncbi:MAG TPA: acyltransferase domain-containing protein [Burkholderiales bacterium]|nr:acyltransferase domain-containing protein [Burkholderiales bacterium]
MGLGIVCSGQGNQSLNMFSPLQSYPEAVGLVTALSQQLGCVLLPQIALTDSELFTNKHAQPLIAGFSYIQWELLKSQLPAPTAFAGYSLGELSSYACSGACNFAQLINLAATRADYMDAAAGQYASSTLLAVSGILQDQLLQFCRDFVVYPAIQNSRDSWVIGGLVENLQNLFNMLNTHFPMYKLNWIKVNLASHTPILAAASEAFATYLSQQVWQDLAAPIVTSVENQVIYAAKDGILSLSQQISNTIHFSRTIEIMQELGVTVILELGAGKALTNIINNLNLGLKVRSFNDFSSLDGIINWVSKNLLSL